MPLVKFEKINQNSSWALWKIEESIEQLLEYVHLPSEDLVELESIHHPRKKLEWLASRAALRALLDHEDQETFRISKDTKGKPYLPEQPFHISLANSFPYGAAIIHRHHATGIDIEKPSNKLLRVKHKFLNADESGRVLEDLDTLCVYWAAKESLYKLYGKRQLSLKQHITVDSIDYDKRISATISLDYQPASFQLIAYRWDNFYVVYSYVD